MTQRARNSSRTNQPLRAFYAPPSGGAESPKLTLAPARTGLGDLHLEHCKPPARSPRYSRSAKFQLSIRPCRLARRPPLLQLPHSTHRQGARRVQGHVHLLGCGRARSGAADERARARLPAQLRAPADLYRCAERRRGRHDRLLAQPPRRRHSE
ncbi:hypothetical protein BC834DRAFT_491079 [Gloeopeniophorella convolvens]|nr:hypothetical protein BC834DRAFT_491079 [Gloeopeniophorella convolvens]